jgi:hypothetical protein
MTLQLMHQCSSLESMQTLALLQQKHEKTCWVCMVCDHNRVPAAGITMHSCMQRPSFCRNLQ